MAARLATREDKIVSGPHPGFTLSQLIEQTAEDLKNAQKPKKDAIMQSTGCELELAVTVGAEAGGGIKFWLVDASAKASGETVSKVKLTFGPLPGQVVAYAVPTSAGKGEPIEGAK